ncbi:hypothetical protein [Flavivirga jejuensis]|uniref:DUF5018 domain-containing protein n=1 Tax=Flavivirga jejuensis TaxID=870487 RepID=A0ABT8WHB5_9FLAO|nr:hypothetical protein [Flavivirga jejuensis]MDO5972553.1 hypothetical protein [Flavivirga jejuensis]
MISFVFATYNNTGLSEDVTATIEEDPKTITATFPIETNVTALIPTIEVSGSVTVSPSGSQDFSSAVTYTVTAEDESTVAYTANITVETSDEKQVLSFVFGATDNDALSNDITTTINEADKSISASVPYGTAITSLTPTIEVSALATVSPTGSQDLSSWNTANVTFCEDFSPFLTTDQLPALGCFE